MEFLIIPGVLYFLRMQRILINEVKVKLAFITQSEIKKRRISYTLITNLLLDTNIYYSFLIQIMRVWFRSNLKVHDTYRILKIQ